MMAELIFYILLTPNNQSGVDLRIQDGGAYERKMAPSAQTGE